VGGLRIRRLEVARCSHRCRNPVTARSGSACLPRTEPTRHDTNRGGPFPQEPYVSERDPGGGRPMGNTAHVSVGRALTWRTVVTLGVVVVAVGEASCTG